MAIVVRLDVMLARRKVRGVRFETLERICEVLQCQPGDLLEWRPGEPADDGPSTD